MFDIITTQPQEMQKNSIKQLSTKELIALTKSVLEELEIRQSASGEEDKNKTQEKKIQNKPKKNTKTEQVLNKPLLDKQLKFRIAQTTTRLPHPALQDYADRFRPDDGIHGTFFLKGFPGDVGVEELQTLLNTVYRYAYRDGDYDTLVSRVSAIIIRYTEDGDSTGAAYVIIDDVEDQDDIDYVLNAFRYLDRPGAPYYCPNLQLKYCSRRLYTEKELDDDLDDYIDERDFLLEQKYGHKGMFRSGLAEKLQPNLQPPSPNHDESSFWDE